MKRLVLVIQNILQLSSWLFDFLDSKKYEKDYLLVKSLRASMQEVRNWFVFLCNE